MPYAVDVEISTRDASFDVDTCLQHRMALTVTDDQKRTRVFDGLPDQVSFVAHQGTDFFFKLRLRPALAALEHREGLRIFQDKTPVDVVKEILKDAGVDEHVEWRLRQTYEPREFLLQYHEREIDFFNRVLAEEGIFYFFLHDDAGHTLVFCDDPDAITAQDGLTPVVLSPRQSVPGAQPMSTFTRKKTLRPTSVLLRDFDFEKPDLPPSGSTPAPGNWPISQFHYPAGFKKDSEGARKSARKISALRHDADLVRGKSRAVGLVAGTPMSVDGANEPWLNGEFVVVEIKSSGKEGIAGGGESDACNNEFTAMPKGAPFAAPLRVKKPKIRGVQAAVVTGPTNEPQAIHVDKYGRIKVRFLWDRSGKTDDTSSCWIRTNQPPLGGSMVLPRVGWEVSVAFLEGDPDRPIVLGRTYNAEHTPPYAQPGAAADGSMKSMSTPGGAGNNEIKMGDSAGKQGMSINSQKDTNVTHGNDKNETVGVDEEHSVGSNYKIVVGSNDTATVTGNQSVDVGNALQIKVTGAQSVTVSGNEDLHAKCDFTEKIGGARDYTISGNLIRISCGVKQNITGAFKRTVDAVQANISLASIDDNMLSTYDEKVGAVIVQLVKGVVAENVTGDKDVTSTAAELHMAVALGTSANGVKNLIGGVHLQKIAGDLVVSAPKIIIGGGVGKFNGGGSSVVLNGGPVTIKGSKIAFDTKALVNAAADLKIG
jgi:type VI secretion system secreted protein VgrG